MTDPLALSVLVLLVLWGGQWVRAAVRDQWPDSWPWETTETPRARVKRRYVNGEISLSDYERELDLLMDDDNERIRERVEVIDGIGPTVAREIAVSFESVGHLERADRAALLAVDDVGPKRADKILAEL